MFRPVPIDGLPPDHWVLEFPTELEIESFNVRTKRPDLNWEKTIFHHHYDKGKYVYNSVEIEIKPGDKELFYSSKLMEWLNTHINLKIDRHYKKNLRLKMIDYSQNTKIIYILRGCMPESPYKFDNGFLSKDETIKFSLIADRVSIE